MKAKILLITLFMTQSVIAQRTCETYVPDDWSNSRYTIETQLNENIVTDNETMQ